MRELREMEKVCTEDEVEDDEDSENERQEGRKDLEREASLLPLNSNH